MELDKALNAKIEEIKRGNAIVDPEADEERGSQPENEDRLGLRGRLDESQIEDMGGVGLVSRRELLSNLAMKLGFDDFDVEDIKPTKKKDVVKTSDLIDQLASIGTVSAVYSTCYTYPALTSESNILKLRRDFKDPLGPMGDLENKQLVARMLYKFNQIAALNEVISLTLISLILFKYACTCRSPSSQGISPSGSKILEYVRNQKLYEKHDVVHEKFAADLDQFAHEKIRLYSRLTQGNFFRRIQAFN
jgi:hypothetical protein